MALIGFLWLCGGFFWIKNLTFKNENFNNLQYNFTSIRECQPKRKKIMEKNGGSTKREFG